MAEDVIEFGPVDAPVRRPPVRRSLPPWLMGPAVLMATVGFFAFLGSLMVPWQTTTVPDTEDTFREIGTNLTGSGPIGAVYVLVAVAALVAVVLALFGHSTIRATARLIGITLAVCGLSVVASLGYTLTRTSTLADFRLLQDADLERVEFTVESGVYLAAGGLAALLVAVLLSTRPYLPAPVEAEDQGAGLGEEPMELEVSVFPASPKAGPGAGHEIYLRP